MNQLFKLLLSLIIPACIVGTAFFFSFRTGYIPPLLQQLLPYLPYVLALAGGLLAWRFKRSRTVFVLAVLVLAYWIVSGFLPEISADSISSGANQKLGYALCAILLPINVMLMGFIDDRGIVTGWGLMQIAFILLQAVGVAFVMYGGFGFLGPHETASMQNTVHSYLYYRLLPSWTDDWTIIPQTALILTVSILIVLGALAAARRDALHTAIFAATLLAFAGMHTVVNPQIGVFYTAAVLILTLALFQESYTMAYVDELTGLPGRRALFADFKKMGRKYAIAMGDIDHFKKFNDTYGHDVGDDVLRMVASKLAQVTGGGTAYRYGGEEFTIVFPKGTAQGAVPHLDAVRKSVEDAEFTIRGPLPKKARGKSTVKVTISLGVAERTDDITTPEAVMKKADQALYKAKKKGRNRVEG